MSDTEEFDDSNAERARIEAYRRMSYGDRWRQAVLLRETAWKLKSAAVRLQHPEWDEGRVRQAVKKIFLYAST